MGKIIEAKFSDILPGEDGFQPSMLISIITQFARGTKLLPVPVRKMYNQKYVQLDGRHRLLYLKMLGVSTASLFVADSDTDSMRQEDFPDVPKYYLEDNNRNLSRKWGCAGGYHLATKTKNFDEFFEILIGNFPWMKSISSFEEYFRANPVVRMQNFSSIHSSSSGKHFLDDDPYWQYFL